MINEEELKKLSTEQIEELRENCREKKKQITILFNDLLEKDPMQGEYAVDLAGDLIRQLCKLENKDAHIQLMMKFEGLVQLICLIAREQGLLEQHVGAILREIELSNHLGR